MFLSAGRADRGVVIFGWMADRRTERSKYACNFGLPRNENDNEKQSDNCYLSVSIQLQANRKDLHKFLGVNDSEEMVYIKNVRKSARKTTLDRQVETQGSSSRSASCPPGAE